LEILGADGGHIRDAQHEADGIEDVGLSGAVEAGDGVEALIPIVDVSARFGLEAASCGEL
jgi:hypothetical protein